MNNKSSFAQGQLKSIVERIERLEEAVPVLDRRERDDGIVDTAPEGSIQRGRLQGCIKIAIGHDEGVA